MIKDLDIVALTRDQPDDGLKAGDVGTVVMVYADGADYEVEFITFAGETVAVLTLDASAVRPLERREMTHARPLQGFA